MWLVHSQKGGKPENQSKGTPFPGMALLCDLVSFAESGPLLSFFLHGMVFAYGDFQKQDIASSLVLPPAHKCVRKTWEASMDT